MKIKYRKSFLIEVERFDRCNRMAGSPAANDIGLHQFFEFESFGKRPDIPDPYFTHLCDGKAWWEWTLNEYANTYLTWDWPGWYMLAIDFLSDKEGFRQLRQRLYQEPIDPDKYIEDADKYLHELQQLVK